MLPTELAEIKVVDEGGASIIVPDLRDALIDSGVKVSDQASMTLRVRGESYSKRVLSVDSSGRATEYGLSYKVRFKLQESEGATWIPDEQLTLQRDLRFDALAVLATSGEEGLLQEEMRRDAVNQILRRLQSVKTPVPEDTIKEKDQ